VAAVAGGALGYGAVWTVSGDLAACGSLKLSHVQPQVEDRSPPPALASLTCQLQLLTTTPGGGYIRGAGPW
jgi:hypothetical protein